MTDQWELNDDSNIDTSNGPKPLRDAYEAQKQRNAELAQQLQETQNAVKALQTSAVFDSLGVPAEVRNLYTGDPKQEDVSAWVNQMRTAFGGSPSGTPAAPVAQTPTAPPVTSEQQAQLQAFTEAGVGQNPSTAIEDLIHAQKTQAKSVKDLIANFNRAHG